MRFHYLIDRELVGGLSPDEREELSRLRRAIDEEAAPRLARMREDFSRQDRMYDEAISLFRESLKPTGVKCRRSDAS